jgi:hypothetical protein
MLRNFEQGPALAHKETVRSQKTLAILTGVYSCASASLFSNSALYLLDTIV